MYEGLRLTELHEEWAWAAGQAATAERDGVNVWQFEVRRDGYDAEIRARVAAQEIAMPACMCGHRADQHPGGTRCVGGECDCMEYYAPGGVELFSGIPDAERVYPAKLRGDGGPLWPEETQFLSPAGVVATPSPHWANHAAHFIPAEGCHLCREGRHV